MRRLLFSVVSIVSLLLCALVCVLWVRANRVVRPDHASFPIPGGRIVARFDPGGITLAGPPPAGPATGEAMVRTLTAVMRNGDIAFGCVSRKDDHFALELASYEVTTRDGRKYDARDFSSNTPNATVSLEQMFGERLATANAYRRPLLEAIEDPDRFAAVHYLLYKIGGRFIARSTTIRMYGPLNFQNGVYVLDFDGLRVEIPPPDENTKRRPASGQPGSVWTYYLDKPRLARVDPAQLPSIRNRWYMLLGTRLVTVPYWLIVLGAAVLPGVWLVRWATFASRNRQGLCPTCGYDLRASTERCPECGTAIPAKDVEVPQS